MLHVMYIVLTIRLLIILEISNRAFVSRELELYGSLRSSEGGHKRAMDLIATLVGDRFRSPF